MGILKHKLTVTLRRSIAFLLLGIVGFLLATACTPNATQNIASNSPIADCKTVQHRFGETRICGKPERIIVLDPPSLDMLLSLGIQPVGLAGTKLGTEQTVIGSPQLGQPVEGVRYFGDRVTSQPIYIGTHQSPSLEAMLVLKPDLILGRYMSGTQYTTVSKVAPVLPLNKDPVEWQQDFIVLAEMVNQQQLANQVIEQYNQTITRTKTKLATVAQGNKILLIDSRGSNNFSILTNRNYMGALLEDIGFDIVVPKLSTPDTGIIPVSLEGMSQLDADIIMVAMRGGVTEAAKQTWEQNSILKSLTNRTDNLLFVDFYLWASLEGPIGAEFMIEDLQTRLLSQKLKN
jgi:iron complex transport system substrate-binding protein